MFIWTSQTTYNVTTLHVSAIYINSPTPTLVVTNKQIRTRSAPTYEVIQEQRFVFPDPPLIMVPSSDEPMEILSTPAPEDTDPCTRGYFRKLLSLSTIQHVMLDLSFIIFMIVSISLVTSSVPRLVSVRRIIILFISHFQHYFIQTFVFL